MRIVYSRRAAAQLEALYRYIAENSSPRRGIDFVNSIMEYCEGFDTFPHRGTKRDDIRPGLRITSFRCRVTIALTADDEAVTILGVFYGGQDVDAALQKDEDTP